MKEAAIRCCPFYHLRSSGFWHLVPVPGMEQALVASRQIDSVRQLRQFVLGAKMDDALFEMLLDEKQRDNLRRVLIESYFAPEIRPLVLRRDESLPSRSSTSMNCLTGCAGDSP